MPDVLICIGWSVIEYVRAVGERKEDISFETLVERLRHKGAVLFRLVSNETTEATETVTVWINSAALPDIGLKALMHARVILDQHASITHDAGESDASALAGKTPYRLIRVTSSPVAVEEVALA